MPALQRSVGIGWGRARALTVHAAIDTGQHQARTRASRATWAGGTPRTAATAATWDRPAPRTRATGLAFGRCTTRLSRATGLAFREFPPRTRALIAEWAETSGRLSGHITAVWRQGAPLTRREAAAWLDVLRERPALRPPPPSCYSPPAIPIIRASTCDYTPPGTPLAIVRDQRQGTPAPLPRALDVHPVAAWAQGRPSTAARRVAWGRVRALHPEIQRDTDTRWDTEIPRVYLVIRSAYMIVHDISLMRASDGVSIPCSAFSLTADADAWADVLNATVHGDDAMDVLIADTPTELLLSVDGVDWRLVVAPGSTRETLQHGRRAVSLTAHSLTALLHTPFVDPTDYAEAADRTAAQLAGDALPDDWTLIWQVGRPLDPAVSWLVPGGVFSYQGATPVELLARVAASVGAVLHAHPTARTLTVRSRYPVLPWDYASAVPTLTIPDGIWLSADRRPARPRQANAVYLSGTTVSGIQGRVYRSGTAGDIYAPAPSADPLLTHGDALRERGGQILAAYAAQSQVRALTIPFDGGTSGQWPLINVGDLLLVERWGGQRDTVMARTLSASITDRSVGVTQTATLGADSGSAYTRLRRVTSDVRPLLLATVTTAYGDGTVTVEYPSGGTERVRGEATVGASVWVRDGRIEGDAPALTAVELAV